MISNICRANFNGGRTAQGNNRFQWDYGQILEISGIEHLPDPFTAQFSNYPVLGTAKTNVGTGGRVEIPNEYFVSGQNIYCFIVLHTGEDDGRTVYIATIPVTKRPKPIDDPITPTQQSTIDTAIAALQAGVSRAEGFAGDAEEQAGIAQNAATTATEAAETATGAVADVEAAATRAETAAEGAEASATAAETSATGAESAKTAALAAQGAAETAAASAEQSATDAGNYAGLSEEAEQDAQAAKTAAEASATAAAVSATAASESASQAAQKASEASESATAAQTSSTNAEAAKTGAEAAQEAAETAQGKAEQAQANSEEAEATAEWYAERVERFLPTDTASGEIASFPDGADGVPMQSVVVSMEPIQDLHGYDHPWPAGGWKNKLNLVAVFGGLGSYSADGSVYTLNAISSRPIIQFAESDGNYILTWDNSAWGGTATNLRLEFYNSADVLITSRYVTEATPYAVNGVCKVKANNGANGSVSIKNPMIRLATETDATFAPYSNICPISGRTGAEVTRTGKNIFPLEININDSAYTHNYSVQDYPSVVGFSQALMRLKGQTVVISAKTTGTASGVAIGQLRLLSGSTLIQSFNPGIPVTVADRDFTSADSIIVYGSTSGATVQDMQMELGSAATAYEPYQGDTLSVSWESEAGTVYGGTLDVVSGELVADRAMVTYDGSENWYTGVITGGTRYRVALDRLPTGIKYVTNNKEIPNCVANLFPVVSANTTWSGNDGIAMQTTYGWRIYCHMFNTSDVTPWKAFLSEHPLTICYELATPITYHLTPQEVRTLLGTNNVWSNAGETAVTYKADVQLYIDKRISALS